MSDDKWMPISEAPMAADFMLSDIRTCLVYGPEIGVQMGRAWRYPDGRAKAQAWGFHGDFTITHWQPLPAAPTAQGVGE